MPGRKKSWDVHAHRNGPSLSSIVPVWRKVDNACPEDRQAAILKCLEANAEMSEYAMCAWIGAHLHMHLSRVESLANIRVLLHAKKITVDRKTQKFSKVQ